ncbi:unnamed protein product, partial [Didymodactylos carnosus]
RAIDKELQNNFWSCGLDPKLKTYETDYDKETRQLMTRYAINDVFAPTCLYFLLEKKHCLFESPTSQFTSALKSSSSPSTLQSIIVKPSEDTTPSSTSTVHMKQNILVYADSHGKDIAKYQPSPASCNYELSVDWLSGRRWLDTYTPYLSAIDTIVTPATVSRLSAISSLILIIATNYVRNIPYHQAILQVHNFITIVQQKFPHITSMAIYYVNNLNANIINYNKELKKLTETLTIHLIETLITTDDLFDELHIDNTKQHIFFNPIFQYCASVNPSYKITEQSQLQQHETHHQPQSEVSDVNDANDKPTASTTPNNNVTILASTSSSSVINNQQELQQQKVKTKSTRTASQNNARNKIRHSRL